jgi:hypothetical protein
MGLLWLVFLIGLKMTVSIMKIVNSWMNRSYLKIET